MIILPSHLGSNFNKFFSSSNIFFRYLLVRLESTTKALSLWHFWKLRRRNSMAFSLANLLVISLMSSLNLPCCWLTGAWISCEDKSDASSSGSLLENMIEFEFMSAGWWLWWCWTADDCLRCERLKWFSIMVKRRGPSSSSICFMWMK